jgi:protein-disulfide isomerase
VNKNFIFKSLNLVKVITLFALLAVKCYSADNNNSKGIVFGDDNAPVKIKIFSSFTCPHCANFHLKIVSEIEKNYIKSGKVQLIFIDFPLDQAALNVSKLMHCLDKDKQINFMDIIYKTQIEWTAGSDLNDINNNLKSIALSMGINSDNFNKCLNNEIVENKILDGRIDGQRKYSINSTPTVIINEKKYEGSFDFKSIKKKIEKLI